MKYGNKRHSGHSQLLSFVDTEFINLAIVFCTDEVDGAVISERSPFCVDQHFFLSVVSAVIEFAVLNFFNVACVASSSYGKKSV
jgi:hypothetical protein